MGTVNKNEKLANLGYLALGKETTKGVAVKPSIFAYLLEEDIKHDIHLDEDNSIVGIREKRFKVFRGQESISGNIKVIAEPTTIGHFFNMLLYKADENGVGDATTGYTHTFTVGGDPKSYTLEFLKGNIPVRLIGAEAKSITPDFQDNKMVLEIAIVARKLFSLAPIASASGTTVVLDDSERPNPTDGLTTGDTLRLYDISAGTYEDVDITAINTDGKTLTVSTISGTYDSGDLAYLAPLTPAYDTLGEPFSWARTQFKFGNDIATALAATQTRMEKDSKWTIKYDLENEEGARRSGGFAPANFVRTNADAEIKLKQFFSDGQDLNQFLQRVPQALVVEHTSPSKAGSNNNALLRIKFNKYYIKSDNVPLKAGSIIYSELDLVPVYSDADGQMFSVELLTDQQTI